MPTVAISEFKAKCLAMLEEVHKTGQPVFVTRHGKPLAMVSRPPHETKPSWIGSMAGTAKIVGDIVGPIADPNDWEANCD